MDGLNDEKKQPLSVWGTAAKAEQDFGIPTGLLRGLGMEESGGLNHWDKSGNLVKSNTGATGAFQFTKGTARQYKINRDNPIENIVGAAKYLTDNYKAIRPHVRDDKEAWLAAAVAHNRGLGAVRGMIKNGVFEPSGNDSGNGGDTRTYASKIANHWADLHEKSGAPSIADASGQSGDFQSEDIPQGEVLGKTPDVYQTDDGLPHPVEMSAGLDTLANIQDKPETESHFTISSQVQSALEPASPRAGVLFTDAAQLANLPPEQSANFIPVETKSGLLAVSSQKAAALDLNSPDEVRNYVAQNGFTGLIGKVSPVEDTSKGIAVRTETPDGKELSTSVVATPKDAVDQMRFDKSEFGGIVGAQHVMPVEDAVAKRKIETRNEAGEVGLPQPNYALPPEATDERKKATNNNFAFRGFDAVPVQSQNKTGGLNAPSPVQSQNKQPRPPAMRSKSAQAGIPQSTGQTAPNAETQQNQPSQTPTVQAQGEALPEQISANSDREILHRGNAGTVNVDLSKKPKNVSATDYLNEQALKSKAAEFGLTDDEIDSFIKAVPQTTRYDKLSDKELAAKTSIPVSIPYGTINSILQRRTGGNSNEIHPELRTQIAQDELKTQAGIEKSFGNDRYFQAKDAEAVKDPLLKQAEDNIYNSPLSGGTKAEVDTEYERLKNFQLSDTAKDYIRAAGIASQGGAPANLGGQNSDFTSGALSSAIGDTADFLAGTIARPLTSVGILPEGVYSALSKIGQGSKIYENAAKSDTAIGEALNFLGHTSVDVPKFIGLTTLTGGSAVLAMGIERAGKTAGTGADLSQVGKEAAKGIVFGALLHGASKFGQAVEDGLLAKFLPKDTITQLYKAKPDIELFTKLAGEGGRIGAVTVGSLAYAKAEGASNKDAAKQTLLLLAQDIVMSGAKFGEIKNLSGEVLRMWKDGEYHDIGFARSPGAGNSFDVFDVTGKVPREAVQAEVISKDKATEDVISRAKNVTPKPVKYLTDGEIPAPKNPAATETPIQTKTPTAKTTTEPQISPDVADALDLKPKVNQTPAKDTLTPESKPIDAPVIGETVSAEVTDKSGETETVKGEVTKTTDKQIVLKMPDGSMKTVPKNKIVAQGLRGTRAQTETPIQAATETGNSLEQAGESTPPKIESSESESVAGTVDSLSTSGKEPYQMTQNEYEQNKKAEQEKLLAEWKSNGSQGIPPSNSLSITDAAKRAKNVGALDKFQDAANGKGNFPEHELVVREALSESKTVPAEVLADYPDLAEKYTSGNSIAENTKDIPQDASAGTAESLAVGKDERKSLENWRKEATQATDEQLQTEYAKVNKYSNDELHRVGEVRKKVVEDELNKRGLSTSAKEPYQMTLGEFKGSGLVNFKKLKGDGEGRIPARFSYKNFHNDEYSDHYGYKGLQSEIIRDAIKNGKTIPEKVLADHPEIQKELLDRQFYDDRKTQLTKLSPEDAKKFHDGVSQVYADSAKPENIKNDLEILESLHPELSKTAQDISLSTSGYKPEPDTRTDTEKAKDEKIEPAEKTVDTAPEKAQNLTQDERPTETRTKSAVELREARPPKSRTAQGKTAKIRIPNSKDAYDANYAVRELEDVIPSHNPFNFAPNADYFHVNDRHYDREKQYQTQVIERSKPENFDPTQLVNNSPTVETGTPVLDADGNVLGGNSRSMMLHRIYADENPAARDAYRDLLIDDAGVYGLEAKDIAKFKNPVLVREISDESINKQTAITDLNKTSTTDLTAKERSVAEASRLSDDAADYITSQIERAGTDATLNDALNQRGAEIVNKLIEDGVFSGGERNTLIENGSITSDGKTRVERLLLGRIFSDLDQMEAVPPYLKRNLERVISPLVKTETDSDWNILPAAREAIDLLTEFGGKGGGLSLADYANQPNMFRPEGWSKKAVAVARILKQSPNNVSRAFKGYAREFQDAKDGTSLFGAMTPKQAFDEFFDGKGNAALKNIEEGKELLAPNGKPSKLTPFQHAQVRTPEFKKYFGDWETAAKETKIIPTNPHGFENFKEAKGWARKNISGSHLNADTGESIIVSNNAIDKYLSGKAVTKSIGRDAHLSALKELPQIIQNAVLVETHPDRSGDPNIKEIQRFYAAVKLGEETQRVKLTVKAFATEKRNNAYSYEVSEIETLGGKSVDASSKGLTSNRTPSISIANLLQGAAKNNGQSFAFSKVVDENGEPLAVNHGTNENFDTFDSGKTGKTDEGFAGKGFYFVNNESIASDYGSQKIDAYLNLKNPLIVDDYKEISEKAGVSEVRDRSGKTSDAIRKNLIEQGYDGVVVRDFDENKQPVNEYVAFEPNQIKSATENNGEYSPENDSILKRAEDEHKISEFHNIKFAPVEDLLEKATVEQSGDLLKVNLEGQEFLRRAMEETKIRAGQMNLGDNAYEGSFSGLFNDRRQTTDLLATLRDIKDNPDEWTPEAANLAGDFADKIDAARDAGEGTTISYMYENRLPHETFHQKSFLNAGVEDLTRRHANPEQLDEHPALKAANENYFKGIAEYDAMPERQRAAVIREEVAAYIAGGESETLGLSTQDAADYMRVWLNSYLLQNARDAESGKIDEAKARKIFADFEKIEGVTYEQINRIKQGYEQHLARQAENPDAEESGNEYSGDGEYSSGQSEQIGSGAERGARSASENNAKAENLDQFTPGGKEKFSQTPESARKAGIPLADRLYTSTTNAEQQDFADRQLDKGLDKAAKWFTENAADKNLNNGATAVVGINLMKRFGESGDLQKMNEIADTLVPMTTEAAQSIQAMSLLAAHDPASAGAYAAKTVKQKTGRDLTTREYDQATEIATNLSETAKADGIGKAILEKAQADLERITAERDAFEKAANRAMRLKIRLTDAVKEIRNLRSKIQRLTDARPLKEKSAVPHSKLFRELKGKESDLLASIRAKFGGDVGLKHIENPALKRIEEGNPPDADLVDWATLTLMENLPKGTMGVGDFKNALDGLTRGKLSDTEISDIHEAAIDRIRGSKPQIDQSKKDSLKMRGEHYKTARTHANRFQAELDNLVKESADKLKSDEKSVGKFDAATTALIEQGVKGDFSDEAIYHALARNNHAPEEAIKRLQAEFPDLDREGVRKAMTDANEITKRARESVKTKAIQKANEFNLKDEEVNRIKEELRVNNLEKMKASRRASQFYESLTKSKTQVAAETAVNFRKANLLTGVKRLIQDVVSNSVFQGAEEVSRIAGSGADILASMVTGERSMQGASPQAVANSIKSIAFSDDVLKNLDKETGLKEAYHILRYGDSERHLRNLQLSESNAADKFGTVGRVADVYINSVFRTLSAGDALFKAAAYRRSLEETAKVQAINEHRADPSINISERRKEILLNPSDAAQIQAIENAEFATFQSGNKISSVVSKVKQSNQAVKTAIDILIPFDRTPTNIVLRILDYSPAGFVRAGKSLIDRQDMPFEQTRDFNNRFRTATAGGLKSDEFDNLPKNEQRARIEEELNKAFKQSKQRDFAKAFGRASTGSLLLAAGFMLAAKGLIAGSMSPNPVLADRAESEEFFARLKAGIENRSILIPGVGRFNLPTDPSMNVLTLGATMFEQMALAKKQKKDSVASIVDGVSSATLDAVAELPIVRTFADYFGRKQSAGGRIGGILSGFIPAEAMLKDIGEVGDATAKRASETPESKKQGWLATQESGFKNAIVSKIPVVRNYFGDKSSTSVSKKERGGVLRRMARMFDVTNMRSPKPYSVGKLPAMRSRQFLSGDASADFGNNSPSQTADPTGDAARKLSKLRGLPQSTNIEDRRGASEEQMAQYKAEAEAKRAEYLARGGQFGVDSNAISDRMIQKRGNEIFNNLADRIERAKSSDEIGKALDAAPNQKMLHQLIEFANKQQKVLNARSAAKAKYSPQAMRPQ